MNSIESFREDPIAIQEKLASRGFEIDIPVEVLSLDASARALTHEVDQLRADRNAITKSLSDHFAKKVEASGSEVDSLRERAVTIRERIQAAEQEKKEAVDAFRETMLGIPNIPDKRTPVGPDYEDFELIYEWGPKPEIDKPLSHALIGQNHGIIDTEAGTMIAGPRFSVLKGKGAKLQRALMNFFMDANTSNGYEEHTVPYIVNASMLEGTGQLPKFKDDVFMVGVGDKEMFLSPTAEVQLTNLARDRVFAEDELPKKLTAYSENFRAEAGSAGRDMAGIFRQHQFPKLELVRLSTAENSWGQLEELTFDAESCIRALGLHYRKVALSTGDIGFSAAFTYDLEVWLPGQDNYREVSSCSNLTDFQARRINAKYISKESGAKEYIHTLNGSSLAIGRTIVAILEQGLQPDGSVVIPEALQDYTKFDKIG